MTTHILGICGTFMGGVALLAKESGLVISGSDENVYPPMSTLLAEQGIELSSGLLTENIPTDTETIVVGNVMARGMPVVEDMLNGSIKYSSGPQWLYENILRDKWVLAVAGTHGKTTTASMLAWILEYAGMNPGFLIGGVPENFGVSARLGGSDFFVVEADEYDTAFFDKRSKFVHYHPKTLVLNNLEFDHADIFADLEAIKTQFHHLMRMVPSQGLVVTNAQEPALDDVLDRGVWTKTERFQADHANDGWSVDYLRADGSEFKVFFEGAEQGIVRWNSLGEHNVANALAAIAAARHVGVPVEHAIDALAEFKGVKRRMQLRGKVGKVSVYDDFAHHPTAITKTLDGLRKNVGSAKITAILEPRSNTMRLGTHKEQLADSLALADQVILYQPSDVDWDMQSVVEGVGDKAILAKDIDDIIATLVNDSSTEYVLIMSNGGFGGIHQRLLDALESHET
ncbi:MAG: UDP-N-acetylmuramate:L-alanyl-gamma-D-glutamyl-meso-diaminopimelate ligase [Thiotrichaceae bacterium]|nr:UDP-N-acetylmuramate:L-alanyl-gamma-D-glutamyl-meso-diaminopimelate ligase [Thiotrichaceae bacterium]